MGETVGVNDFDWRPGETIEVDGDEARARALLFRDVLGRYASGVTVVTTSTVGEPAAMTCQSFTSVSLDPPLVAFLPTRESRAFVAIRESGLFCVNFLAVGQAAIADQMALREGDKFAGVAWKPSKVTGSPLLQGTLGHVDCTVDAVHEAGDHFLVIGKVVDLAVGEEQEPLLYHRGAYRS